MFKSVSSGAGVVAALVLAFAIGLATPAAAGSPPATGPASDGVAVEPADASIAAEGTIIDVGAQGCPSGFFCIWVLPGFGGVGYGWTGSDRDWRDAIIRPIGGNPVPANDRDRSWVNHGTSCAGCDHVRVYDGVNYSIARTICLARGQEVASRPAASGRGASHSWYGSC
jgi:hypothetical protein